MIHREAFTGRRIYGTNGILWYIYLQFYHKNQRIYVYKYTVRPMDPMGYDGSTHCILGDTDSRKRFVWRDGLSCNSSKASEQFAKKPKNAGA